MENKISIEYNLNEAQVLLQLIDIAVKSQGLRAAEAAVVLAKKVEEKLAAANPAPAPTQESQDSFPNS
jgi:hypothetical protein